MMTSPKRSSWIVAGLAVLLLTFACDREPPLTPPKVDFQQQAAEASQGDDFITEDVQAFADSVRAIGNGNKLYVQVKLEGRAPVGRGAFAAAPVDGDLIIGLRRGVPESARRAQVEPEMVPMGVKTAVKETVANALTDRDQIDQLVFLAQSLPFLIVYAPDRDLVAVITALLDHPLVDYLEAVENRPVQIMGNATAAATTFIRRRSQFTDTKINFHRVNQAWTQAGTKGEGVNVYILDSGMIFNHSDGTANHVALGFLGYPSCSPPTCENRDGQDTA